MKNQKERIAEKVYEDDRLVTTLSRRKVIYRTKSSTYVHVLGKKLPVLTDENGLYYEVRYKKLKPLLGGLRMNNFRDNSL